MSFVPLDGDTLDQFYADYQRSTAESIAGAQEERAWQKAYQAQAYMHTAATPTNITRFMHSDPTKKPLPFGPVTPEYEAELTQQQQDFVATLEDAYTQYKGEIPLTWFMQFDVNDLRTMNADELGLDMEWIANWQMFTAQHTEFQQKVEEETDRRFEANNRWRQFQNEQVLGTSRIYDFLNPFGDNPFGPSAKEAFDVISAQGTVERDKVREEVWLEFTGQRDKLFEDDIAKWREERRAELLESGDGEAERRSDLFNSIKEELFPGTAGQPLTPEQNQQVKEQLAVRDTGSDIDSRLDQEEDEFRRAIISGGDPGDLLDQRTAFHNVVAGGLSGFAWGVDKAATGVGGALWLADEIVPGRGAYDWMREQHEAQQAEVIAEYEKLTNQSDKEVIARAAQVGAEQAWAELPEENPEAYQQFLDMADGDQFQAAGLFFMGIAENPDVQDQLGQLLEDTRRQDEEFLIELREQDFRFSHQVMDLLSAWGRNGPGRLATSFTLLLTDQDYWDQLTTGRFTELWTNLGETSERYGHTPSNALGLDGSLLGLSADLGLGIAFDPTTYFLGPKFLGAAKGRLMGTVDEATAVARSAPVRAMKDDIINWNQSPSRGALASYLQMSWLDDVAIGEVLDVTGLAPKQLPHRPWTRHATGKGAMEVQTSWLRKLIPEGTELEIGSLADDILAKGFEEAGEISISRVNGTIRLSDGAKRVLAAEQAGITHVPVRLRLTDVTPSNVAPAVTKSSDLPALQKWPDSSPAPKPTVDVLERIADVIRTTDEQITDHPGGLQGLADDMKANGFDPKQPLVVEYNRVLDQILLVDGNHRLAAAKMAGIKKPLPVILRETVDDLNVGRSPKAAAARPVGRYTEMFHLWTGNRPKGAAVARAVDEKTILPGKSLDDVLEGGAASVKKQLKNHLELAGDNVVRPDRIIPGRDLLGPVDKVRLDKIVEDAVLRGARPQDGARAIAHSSLAGRVRSVLKSAVPEEVRTFFTQANTLTRIDLHGSGSVKRIMEQAQKMWGDNIGKADEWMTKILEYQRGAVAATKNAEAHLASVAPRLQEIQALLDQVGDVAVDVGGDKAAFKAAKKKRQSLEIELRKIYKELDTMPNHADLADLITEMWEDFNRTKIVPRWKKEIAKFGDEVFDAEKGIVKWEYLRRGRIRDSSGKRQWSPDKEWLPESLQQQAALEGIENPEKLVRFLNSVIETPMAVNLPISPLEMIAAGTVSGRAWTKFSKVLVMDAVREGALSLQKAWVIDKVIRPATAMTVSGDELLRIFHKGGRWAVNRYIQDRALFLSARVQHALHGGGNPLTKVASRDAVRKGARYSDKVQARLRQLDEYAFRSKQWEREFFEDHGSGWTDIHPGDPIYRDAAKQWLGSMMQESGFRAFLRGEKAFREWFFSVDGERMRNATIAKKTPKGKMSTVVATPELAFKGWKTMFEDVILSVAKKDGMFDDVMKAFRETADAIDAQGGRPRDLPEFVYDHMGPVRGTQKSSRSKASPLQLTDAFFDRYFLDPVQYRRGFVADMVAQVEKARIEALLLSQGKKILSDTDVAMALGYKGLANSNRTGVRGFITEQALKRDMVPQSYIDDLVQRAAEAEMDHMLYVAERGSRLGNVATSTVFPFGKPHADMMAFWGREMFRRPHFRGHMNSANHNALGDLITAKGVINPRTPALISRLSATDFTIDQGWAGEVERGEQKGLLPNSERTDLSPLLFLPTGGENPLYSLVPGAGYLPMWGLDMALGALGDPLNDPLGYQELVDTIGDVVAGAHFGNADPLTSLRQRFMGGGTFGQTLETTFDAYVLASRLFGDSGAGYGGLAATLSQPDREIDRGRQASAIMADPAEWEELLSLGDQESINLYIDAIALEADIAAAKGNVSENVTRFFVSANNKFAGELDELKQVWIDAAGQFPYLGTPGFDSEAASPESRTQEAAEIRGRFFDLPQWQRDALIAQAPQLSVNLISSWDWTDDAHSAGLKGTEIAYRTDGSREGLARHEFYVQQGYIRPLAPQERLRRMIGLALSAQESTAKRVYTNAAGQVNELIWDSVVTPEAKAYLDSLYTGNSNYWNGIGIQSGQEIWAGWGRYEERFEDYAARAMGVSKDRAGSGEQPTPFDNIRAAVQLPAEMKPWGVSWPGVDPDQLSARMKAVRFGEATFTPELRTVAEAAGIELVPGMTGEQLYSAVQAAVTKTDTPLKAHVDPAYQTYVGERSAASRVVDEQLRSISFNPQYDEEWRQGVNDFLEFESNTADRWRDEALGIPSEDQQAVQAAFMELRNTSDDHVVTDWQQLWDLRYKRTYGPLDWTPPEPLSPEDEEGNVRNGTYYPIIKHIIDGDSMVVKDRVGGQQYHEVRLLGVRARDYGLDDEGAGLDKDRLWDRLQQALEDGDSIRLVRQPDVFGNVDIYGRELAWLWIGDEPFYFANEMLPNRDPSGGAK